MKQDRTKGSSNGISTYETALALHRKDALSVVKIAFYLHGEDEDIRSLGRDIMRDLVATGGMAALDNIR